MIKDKPALCKCPKCRSGNVDLIERHDHGYSTYGRFWYRVECLECGYFIADREEFNSEALLVYPEGDCIKVWNLYSQPVKATLITELVGALEEAEEYFDQRSDADMDQDGYIPNEEMKLLISLREALTKAKDQTNDR